MSDYEIRTITVAVGPKNQPLYSEMVTEVRITDESGGEFVEVEQSGRTDIGKIMINPEEWPALRGAIDRMIADCRLQEQSMSHEAGKGDTPTYLWECNQCGSQEYTMCVSEVDVQELGCGACGGDEWHKAEERRANHE